MTERTVTDEQLGRLARRLNELFCRVRKGTLPIDSVLRALQNVIEGKFLSEKYIKLIHDVYRPIAEQVAVYLRAFQRDYIPAPTNKIRERLVSLLEQEESIKWPDNPNHAWVVYITWEDEYATAKYLWELIKSHHGQNLLTDYLNNFDYEHMRLIPEIQFKPFDLKLVQIDIGANRERSSLDVRDCNSPGLELLAFAAVHDEYIRNMNGMEQYPYLDCPGIQLYNKEDNSWCRVAHLDFIRCIDSVRLFTNRETNPGKKWSVPVINSYMQF